MVEVKMERSQQKASLVLFAALLSLLLLGGGAVAERSVSLSASYVMTRSIAALTEPLVSEGKLYFGGAGKLRWETVSPSRSVLVINGSRGALHYPDLGVTKAFDIGTDPVMKMLSENLLALSTGDLSGLERHYAISGDVVKRLVPKSAEVQKIFKELRVELTAANVARKVELVSAGGDVTRIEFAEVDLSPSLKADLFEIPK